jgi:multiple sugar transport system permease protein
VKAGLKSVKSERYEGAVHAGRTTDGAARTLRGRALERFSLRHREAAAFYVFASPWIIGFAVFSLGPIIAAGYFSFTDLQAPNLQAGLPDFVGLKNYQQMFHDSLFWRSVEATAIWVFGGLFLNTVVGILLAQLLNQRIPGLRIFRTLYYMPTVVAGVAAGYIWLFMLRKDDGVVNGLLAGLHLGPIDWLAGSATARLALLLFNLWFVGQSMVLYLAAIQAIPPVLHEAAHLDGAGPIRRFWRITLPMISPVILFNITIGLIALLQAFIPAFVITQGGPNYATWLYGFGIYNEGFTYQHTGYASAWAVVLFVVAVLLSLGLFGGARRFVHYQGGR